MSDVISRCEADRVCFRRSSAFLHRDTDMCNMTSHVKHEATAAVGVGGDENAQVRRIHCELPLPVDKLAEACERSLFPAVKVKFEVFCFPGLVK